MAGAGYKLFQTGDVLTAAQVNTYLNEQTVMVFANAAARTSALTSVLAEGMVSYLQDTNAVEVYNGSAWVGVSGAGDITEVQAGVGISIASGTGPIPVITNSSTDLITTAGDILYGTAADTVARLGIGTAGQVLKVNSGATAPEWGAAGGSSGPTFRAYRNTNQTVSTGTWVKVDFDTEDWDTASNFSSARFTATTAGYYQFNYMVNFAGTANNIVLYKNGTRYSGGHFGNEDGWKNGSCLVYLNGSSDYVEIYVYTNNATLYGGSDQTMFDGVWIRS